MKSILMALILAAGLTGPAHAASILTFLEEDDGPFFAGPTSRSAMVERKIGLFTRMRRPSAVMTGGSGPVVVTGTSRFKVIKLPNGPAFLQDGAGDTGGPAKTDFQSPPNWLGSPDVPKGPPVTPVVLGISTSLVSAVPEPGTWIMMILGFGFVALRLRRKGKARIATA